MAGLLFRGATVIDGTGADRYRADVTVTDGFIADINTDKPGAERPTATRTIDALSAGPPGHIVINAPRLPPIGSPSGQLPRLTA